MTPEKMITEMTRIGLLRSKKGTFALSPFEPHFESIKELIDSTTDPDACALFFDRLLFAASLRDEELKDTCLVLKASILAETGIAGEDEEGEVQLMVDDEAQGKELIFDAIPKSYPLLRKTTLAMYHGALFELEEDCDCDDCSTSEEYVPKAKAVRRLGQSQNLVM